MGMKMDSGRKRKKRMKRQALRSLGDVLLAVIGKREHEETHFRERTYECMCALHFFWGKVGQDKLRAYIHAEQHPRTLL